MISRTGFSLLRIRTNLSILFLFLLLSKAIYAQDAAQPAPTCAVNQIANGQTCTCAPGYFTSTSDESKARCEDECEEVYFSYFTSGSCVKGLFDRLGKDKQPACNLRCGMRIRLWATVAIFCVIAASIATLIFTLPMCIASCASCLHSRKASKHSKRVYAEQQQQPNKEQQLQALSYNPYTYWPYYARPLEKKTSKDRPNPTDSIVDLIFSLDNILTETLETLENNESQI